jgi:hypothetical protein
MFLASVLKWVSGGLLFLWLITLVGYQVERRGHAKAKERIVELVNKLNEISSKRNDQRETTTERIRVVTRTIGAADRVAKKIEAAPLPGQCKTPSEVLQADL